MRQCIPSHPRFHRDLIITLPAFNSTPSTPSTRQAAHHHHLQWRGASPFVAFYRILSPSIPIPSSRSCSGIPSAMSLRCLLLVRVFRPPGKGGMWNVGRLGIQLTRCAKAYAGTTVLSPDQTTRHGLLSSPFAKRAFGRTNPYVCSR